MDYKIQDLIDIEQFQKLQDRLNAIYSFPSAIIDNEGNILTATAWQDICVKFHRANPETAAECLKSDQYILEHLDEANPSVSYRCPHGLIDNATPIIIEGMHYGNFFTGQFFLEEPDIDFFLKQAAKYGFEEESYLDAVKKVPIWTKEQLDSYLFFIKGLIEVISSIGLKNRREIEIRKRIDASEKMLSTILNSVPQAIFWKDINGIYLGCNRSFAKAVDIDDPERIIGKTDFDLPWPREEAEAYRSDDQEVIRGNKIKSHIIEPLQQADGKRLWIDTTKVPLTDEKGEPFAILGMFDDITDKKVSEEALLKRERQLAESQRIAHIGSWEHNIKTNEVFWSDELFRLLGLDPETDPGDFNVFFEMVHPDDRPKLKAHIDDTLQNKTPFAIEYRFILRDGRIRIIYAQAELIPDDDGELVILSGTAQDMTERKTAEEKIRQSEQFIKRILNTVDEGFIVIDREYRITKANRAYCDMTGITEDEIIGMRCHKASHKSDVPCHEVGEDCPVKAVLETGKPAHTMHRHKDKEGDLIYVETKAYPIVDKYENVTSIIKTVSNITERHLLEEERLKTQKLESIGNIAGGIAHDFNNLLQGVFGYISMAKEGTKQNEEISSLLEDAERGLNLAVNLTNQLLTFSKGGKPVKEKVDISDVVKKAAGFALSGSKTAFRLDLCEDLWMVNGDSGQLSQAIQNIVLNADQAMPNGGVVEISVHNIAADSEQSTSKGLTGEQYVCIEIRDSGTGISEDNLGRIFDPYFTTKNSGNGLGLSTTYYIIRNHAGAIGVSSNNTGTTFTIFLPAVYSSDSKEKVIETEHPMGKKGSILVMDDEELVRRVARKMLSMLGHEMEFAANGQEAIEKYRLAKEAGKPFDLIILDLTIKGGMGGHEAIQEIAKIDPGVVAVVSSGYGDNSIMSDYRNFGFSGILMKPYTMGNLRKCLDNLLPK